MNTELMPSAGLWLADEAATERAGALLASALRHGDLIDLRGDLGAGKTCLVRGLVCALGIDHGAVSSPTYALIHTYEGSPPLASIAHIDLYRLEDADDLESTGYWDVLREADLTLVEWGDRIPVATRSATWRLRLERHGEGRALWIERAPDAARAAVLDAWGEGRIQR